MLRHKERDEEAGGEGLGRLQTRKRLWRDETGAVVAKRRPEHEKRSLSVGLQSKPMSISHPNALHLDNPLTDQNGVSLPTLRPFEDVVNGSADLDSLNDHRRVSSPAEEPWPIQTPAISLPGHDNEIVESFDFLCNASWGLDPHENGGSDVMYNDNFAPDSCKTIQFLF